MTRVLNYATQSIVNVGPFVDATDGVTPETALTLSAGVAELYSPGAVASIDVSGRTWAHIAYGMYRITLTVADLTYTGSMFLHVHPAGARPVAIDILAVQNSTFEGWLLGSATPANMTQINGNSTAASNLGSSALGLTALNVQAGSSTTQVLTNLTPSVNNHFAGRTLVFTSGTLAGQATTITAYNGVTKTLTVAAVTSAPAAATTAIIV